MCQAAQLAEAEGYEEEVILAAFFHDIGHFCEHIMPVQQMNGYGVVDHEKLGADYLRGKGFSERYRQPGTKSCTGEKISHLSLS